MQVSCFWVGLKWGCRGLLSSWEVVPLRGWGRWFQQWLWACQGFRQRCSHSTLWSRAVQFHQGLNRHRAGICFLWMRHSSPEMLWLGRKRQGWLGLWQLHGYLLVPQILLGPCRTKLPVQDQPVRLGIPRDLWCRGRSCKGSKIHHSKSSALFFNLFLLVGVYFCLQ